MRARWLVVGLLATAWVVRAANIVSSGDSQTDVTGLLADYHLYEQSVHNKASGPSQAVFGDLYAWNGQSFHQGTAHPRDQDSVPLWGYECHNGLGISLVIPDQIRNDVDSATVTALLLPQFVHGHRRLFGSVALHDGKVLWEGAGTSHSLPKNKNGLVKGGVWSSFVVEYTKATGTIEVFVDGLKVVVVAGVPHLEIPPELNFMHNSKSAEGQAGYTGGMVARVRVFDHALSDAEMKHLDDLPGIVLEDRHNVHSHHREHPHEHAHSHEKGPPRHHESQTDLLEHKEHLNAVNVNNAAEANRMKAELKRETNEKSRAAAESTRLTDELSRLDAVAGYRETLKQMEGLETELKNEGATATRDYINEATAENAMESAETSRANAEAARQNDALEWERRTRVDTNVDPNEMTKRSKAYVHVKAKELGNVVKKLESLEEETRKSLAEVKARSGTVANGKSSEEKTKDDSAANIAFTKAETRNNVLTSVIANLKKKLATIGAVIDKVTSDIDRESNREIPDSVMKALRALHQEGVHQKRMVDQIWSEMGSERQDRTIMGLMKDVDSLEQRAIDYINRVPSRQIKRKELQNHLETLRRTSKINVKLLENVWGDAHKYKDGELQEMLRELDTRFQKFSEGLVQLGEDMMAKKDTPFDRATYDIVMNDLDQKAKEDQEEKASLQGHARHITGIISRVKKLLANQSQWAARHADSIRKVNPQAKLPENPVGDAHRYLDILKESLVKLTNEDSIDEVSQKDTVREGHAMSDALREVKATAGVDQSKKEKEKTKADKEKENNEIGSTETDQAERVSSVTEKPLVTKARDALKHVMELLSLEVVSQKGHKKGHHHGSHGQKKHTNHHGHHGKSSHVKNATHGDTSKSKKFDSSEVDKELQEMQQQIGDMDEYDKSHGGDDDTSGGDTSSFESDESKKMIHATKKHHKHKGKKSTSRKGHDHMRKNEIAKDLQSHQNDDDQSDAEFEKMMGEAEELSGQLKTLSHDGESDDVAVDVQPESTGSEVDHSRKHSGGDQGSEAEAAEEAEEPEEAEGTEGEEHGQGESEASEHKEQLQSVKRSSHHQEDEKSHSKKHSKHHKAEHKSRKHHHHQHRDHHHHRHHGKEAEEHHKSHRAAGKIVHKVHVVKPHKQGRNGGDVKRELSKETVAMDEKATATVNEKEEKDWHDINEKMHHIHEMERDYKMISEPSATVSNSDADVQQVADSLGIDRFSADDDMRDESGSATIKDDAHEIPEDEEILKRDSKKLMDEENMMIKSTEFHHKKQQRHHHHHHHHHHQQQRKVPDVQMEEKVDNHGKMDELRSEQDNLASMFKEMDHHDMKTMMHRWDDYDSGELAPSIGAPTRLSGVLNPQKEEGLKYSPPALTEGIIRPADEDVKSKDPLANKPKPTHDSPDDDTVSGGESNVDVALPPNSNSTASDATPAVDDSPVDVVDDTVSNSTEFNNGVSAVVSQSANITATVANDSVNNTSDGFSRDDDDSAQNDAEGDGGPQEPSEVIDAGENRSKTNTTSSHAVNRSTANSSLPVEHIHRAHSIVHNVTNLNTTELRKHTSLDEKASEQATDLLLNKYPALKNVTAEGGRACAYGCFIQPDGPKHDDELAKCMIRCLAQAAEVPKDKDEESEPSAIADAIANRTATVLGNLTALEAEIESQDEDVTIHTVEAHIERILSDVGEVQKAVANRLAKGKALMETMLKQVDDTQQKHNERMSSIEKIVNEAAQRQLADEDKFLALLKGLAFEQYHQLHRALNEFYMKYRTADIALDVPHAARSGSHDHVSTHGQSKGIIPLKDVAKDYHDTQSNIFDWSLKNHRHFNDFIHGPVETALDGLRTKSEKNDALEKAAENAAPSVKKAEVEGARNAAKEMLAKAMGKVQNSMEEMDEQVIHVAPPSHSAPASHDAESVGSGVFHVHKHVNTPSMHEGVVSSASAQKAKGVSTKVPLKKNKPITPLAFEHRAQLNPKDRTKWTVYLDDLSSRLDKAFLDHSDKLNHTRNVVKDTSDMTVDVLHRLQALKHVMGQLHFNDRWTNSESERSRFGEQDSSMIDLRQEYLERILGTEAKQWKDELESQEKMTKEQVMNALHAKAALLLNATRAAHHLRMSTFRHEMHHTFGLLLGQVHELENKLGISLDNVRTAIDSMESSMDERIRSLLGKKDK